MNKLRIFAVSSIVLLCGLASFGQRMGKIQYASISNPSRIVTGQRCEKWCWAASIEMIFKSYQVKQTQEDVVGKIFGDVKLCAPLQSKKNLLIGINGTYDQGNSQISLRGTEIDWKDIVPVDLVNSIINNRPIMLIMDGHAVVVTGITWRHVYDTTGKPVALRIRAMEVIDPYFTYGAKQFQTLRLNKKTTARLVGVVLVEPESV